MNSPITSNDLIEILVTFITILGTYFITKFQLMSPNKIEIKQQQLKRIYLPLYKLITDTHIEFMNQDQLIEFLNRITDIVESNYLLVYPDLLDIYKDLKFDIYSYQDISVSYKNFCNIIFYDFEKLKRYLGYPSESYKDFFARVDTPTKIKEVLSWLSLLVLIAPIFYIASLDNISAFTIIKFSTFYIIAFVWIGKFSDFLTSIQRRK